jgi:hypothetical protein
MAYTIYHADGTPVNVPDNAIDTEFYNSNANGIGIGIGTQLVGRNAINYGTPTAQNFLQITENFAGTVMPSDSIALQGQLWFEKTNTTSGKLHVRIANATSGSAANWREIVAYDASGNITANNITATGEFIGSGAGLSNIPVSAIVGLKNWSVVNPTAGSEKDGDIKVVGSVISIYAAGSWNKVFPAIYS